MESIFRKTRLAAAIGAAMTMGLAAPANAVVVVGGDNGWEISFDGLINLFYNQISSETTVSGVETSIDEDSAHLQEGLLPAFFSFNAKSPTVNGLTGTARVTFAPDASSSKNTFNDKAGTIDMREVVVNVDGSFGTISFGRTLGIFARQAILKDQTLFGVGDPFGLDNGGTTLGRIGQGYIYPEFRTRFAYKTPDINGFRFEVGLFDPNELTIGGPSSDFETDTPRFEAEATYATTFSGGTFNVWVSGLWQEMDVTAVAGATADVTNEGIDVGAQLGFGGFNFVGYYYTGEALGSDVKWGGGSYLGSSGSLVKGIIAPGWRCNVAGTSCNEADNDGFYVQGGYTFNGKTKVSGSYGESNQDSDDDTSAANLDFDEVEHQMWTVGVYHDVTPWLKLVGEYNDGESQDHNLAGAPLQGRDFEVFSVGAFMFW